VKTDLVDDWMDDLRQADADRAALVERLRRLILGVNPKVTEAIKYGGILFSAGPPFCGVFSYTDHVSLEFARGAELPDPHRVLEGEGKLRRHIKLRAAPELFSKNVKAYVELGVAAALGSVKARQRTKTRG
jgi:hypothetical protein